LTKVEYEQGQMLVVTWLDAHNLECGWQDMKEVKFSKAEVQTVGHFVAVAQEQLWLAADWCEEDDMVNTVVGIPLGMVVTVREIDNG
jgi:hypothetical protein